MKRLNSIILSLSMIFAPVLQTYAQVNTVEGKQTPGFYSTTNFVKNPFGDTNTQNVTFPATTLEVSATGKLEGKKSFIMKPTASGQIFKWATSKFDKVGPNCEGRFTYVGDGSKYKAYVLQGANKLSQEYFLSPTTREREIVLGFACVDPAGAMIEVAVESLAADPSGMTADFFYAGKSLPGSSYNSSRRAGEIFASASAFCPSGSFVADGTPIARTQYAALFAAIGTAHGDGTKNADGTTSSFAAGTGFNTPDLRGRFLRGVAGTSTLDPNKTSRTAANTGGNTGNAVGSVQGQATAKNGLSISDPGHSHGVYVGFNNNTNYGNYIPPLANNNDGGTRTTTSSTTGVSLSAGDSETRPVNTYVTYCIQFEDYGSGQVIQQSQILDLVGTVVTSAGSCPVGTLDTNGASLKQSSFYRLFQKIGTSHGNGSTNPSGVTASSGCPASTGCFNAPDYRGLFLRGVDGVAGRDVDKAGRSAMYTGGNTGNSVGTYQGQATRKNGLSLSDPGHSHNIDYWRPSGGPYGLGGGASGVGSGTAVATTGISLSNGDNETRPINVSVNYCLVYDTAAYLPIFLNTVLAPDYAGQTVINTTKSVNADYTATDKDETILVDSTVATRTITLPNAALFKGKKFIVAQDSAANQVVINSQGGQICRQTSIKLSGLADRVELQSDGSKWFDPTGTCTITRSAYVDGSNVITNETGYNFLQSCTASRACLFHPGIFSAKPGCQTNLYSTAVDNGVYWASITQTGFTMVTWAGSLGTNDPVEVTCKGPR